MTCAATRLPVSLPRSTPITPARSRLHRGALYLLKSCTTLAFRMLLTSTNFAFDLSGWRVNGLDFTFPSGTALGSRQFFVLAKKRGAFTTAYGLTIPIAGEFDGELDPDGETLSLVKPGVTEAEDIVIDRVRYEATAPWPPSPEGIGAALQLVDVEQDNSRPSNWSDASGWRFFSFNGTLGPSTNQFRLFLSTVGTIYIDDLALVEGAIPETGANLIRNGDFEGPLLDTEGGPWIFSNVALSNTVVSTDIKHAGNGALKLVHEVPGP